MAPAHDGRRIFAAGVTGDGVAMARLTDLPADMAQHLADLECPEFAMSRIAG
jgi:hypothetical protein